jgi:hypothetical protein
MQEKIIMDGMCGFDCCFANLFIYLIKKSEKNNLFDFFKSEKRNSYIVFIMEENLL